MSLNRLQANAPESLDSYRSLQEVTDAMVMYSIPVNESNPSVKIRTANSNWSKTIPLGAAGTVGEIVLPNNEKAKGGQLGLSIKFAWGKYQRTKVVTLVSRFLFINNTHLNIKIRQSDSWG
jgi:vacuolar protein sorting-associated protein 13A/C